jgi:hypothetical protein
VEVSSVGGGKDSASRTNANSKTIAISIADYEGISGYESITGSQGFTHDEGKLISFAREDKDAVVTFKDGRDACCFPLDFEVMWP